MRLGTIFEQGYAKKEKSKETFGMESRKILVVEDNPDNHRLVEMILSHMGHQPVILENGEEALSWCQKNTPDLILMDVSLPKISGIEVTKVLRTYPQCKEIPIIAMTAYAMRGDKERILASGFDHYLGKPYRPNELMELIQHFLPAPL